MVSFSYKVSQYYQTNLILELNMDTEETKKCATCGAEMTGEKCEACEKSTTTEETPTVADAPAE
jgi:recombinational DNA repair protein RecR